MIEAPRSKDAEAQVLGGMLVEPRVIADVTSVLHVDDLAFPSHREMFSAITSLAGRGVDVDPVSVLAELRARKFPDLDRVQQLIVECANPLNALHHAKVVRELSGLRKLMQTGQALVERAAIPGAKLDQLVAQAEREVFEVAVNGQRQATPVQWRTAVADAIDVLEYRFQSGSVLTGLPTGLVQIDERLGGLQAGWLVFLGARPGVGKTALALQIACHVASKGHRVMFVSLEMSASELATRAVCARAGVSYTQVRHNLLKPHDWKRFTEAQEEQEGMDMAVFDEGVETVPAIMTRARRYKPSLVVVDYVQLMYAEGHELSRQQEIADISRGLKLMAKQLQIPVLACSQINRSPEKREEKRPQLADLRDSGSLEQDADVVYLLHRRERAPIVEAIAAKFRHGPTGTDELTWEPHLTRFTDRIKQGSLG